MSNAEGPTRLAGLPDRLLSIDEAADYLNVSVTWVQDQVRMHKIPCTRIGKHVRFTHAHVAQILAAGEQPVLVKSAGRGRL